MTFVRGRQRLRLIQELALGARSQVELAEQFGVRQPTISDFRRQYADRIDTARARIEDELAGLWIYEKANRLAEYEADVEQINERLEQDPLPDDYVKLYAAKSRALRNAAEELGQLAPRSVNLTSRVHYTIEGVDMDALR